MSSGSPQAQALLGALSVAANLARHRHSCEHDDSQLQLRAGVLAHLVDALVTQKVDVVKEGFTAVLGQYAEQAHHYMAQQRSYADRELDTDDPMRRIELRARVQDIDTVLATLRADARLAFAQMTEIVRALGGAFHDLPQDLSLSLALPRPI